MTTPFLEADIETEEGFRAKAYQDQFGVWTIGYGHTGPEVVPGLVWSVQRAAQQMAYDLSMTIKALDQNLSWWRKLTDPRQDVLVQMAFQLGMGGLLKFHRTLTDIEDGNYSQAAVDMGQSLWARQTTNREQRLAQQMLSDERVPRAA